MRRIHALLEERSDSVAEHVRLNLEWHRAVMSASRNELLIAFFEAIAQSVHAATEIQNLNSVKVRREVIRVHELIFAAIEAKDPDSAFRRMQGHLRSYALKVRQISARNAAGGNKRPL
jgi:DNA-binding FadR family transcriptional regulator